ncbi:PfkB family carbohydrate kinase [Promicromonospora vindobonensis]|uniref:Ribokinase n=1 Tax=Promicromonospora vindobonensis TaxID=195748 RepID=A0ABW5VXC6_9MICO
MSDRPVILVFGAINHDEVARVPRHPMPGETVVTGSIEFFQGGKGANQAYAAANAGGSRVSVQMVGAVGDDAAGQAAVDSLAAAGVDTTLVKQVIDRPTGRAYITVSDDGQNTIVVGLGANAYVSPSNLVLAQRPDVAVAQTELGSAAVEALCAFAVEVGARLIINDGPAVPLSVAALRAADPLVVNQHEALDLMGLDTWEGEQAALAAELRARHDVRSVIITLGSEGSVVADAHGARAHPPVAARRVVDTTGAGDTFVGALSVGLALGEDIDSAVALASAAAARSVEWKGARAPLAPPAGGRRARQAGLPAH